MADSVLAEPFFLIDEPVVKHCAYSRSKLHNIQFTWTINNFSFCKQKVGEVLKSPPFFADANDIKWVLQLYPKGEAEQDKKYLSVFLECSNKLDVLGKYKISILNADPHETHSTKTDVSIFNLSTGFAWGSSKFIGLETLLDESNGYLIEDELTLLCEVSYVTESVNTSYQKSDEEFKVPECSLCDDLGNLLDNSKFSDVTLVVGEHEFHVHKAILAARSDVFAAMFQHEMKERKLNMVTVTDLNHEVIQEMLHFIYTGRAPKTKEMAIDLLAAADKYALKKLKVMCEEALFAGLSIETAAETLVSADLHSADQLKERTIRYINAHAKAVIKTKGWQTMVNANAHSLLIAEIFAALFKQHLQI